MLVEINNTHQSSGLAKVCDFQIETNGVMIKALTSRLYSNPIASIVRELASNALDACSTQPMRIRVPTPLDSSFSVRDYGPGLSPQQMVEVFTRFGASTKRKDNSQIGGFGLGAKSPFALVNSYTIVSHHEGTKTTYMASITNNGMPTLHTLGSTPTNETGLEIIVPSAPTPSWVEALSQIQFFQPRPIITGCTFDYVDPTYDTPSYLIMPSGDPQVLIGPVAYPLNKDRITPDRIPPLVLKLPIGGIEVTASREEIVYSAATISTLKQHLASAISDYKLRVGTLLSRCTTAAEAWRILRGEIFDQQRTITVNGSIYPITSQAVTIPSSTYRHLHRSSRRRKRWNFVSVASDTFSLFREDVVYLEDDSRKLQERIEPHFRTLPNVNNATDIYLVKDRTHFDNLGIPVYPISSLPYAGTLRATPQPRKLRIMGDRDKLIPCPANSQPITHYLKVTDTLEWRGHTLTTDNCRLMRARTGINFCIVTPTSKANLDGLLDFGPLYDAIVAQFWATSAPASKNSAHFSMDIDSLRRPLYRACANLGLLPPAPPDHKGPEHLHRWADIGTFCTNLPPLPPAPPYKEAFTTLQKSNPHIRLLAGCTSWSSMDVPALTDLVNLIFKE
jgi:hypothetical protein